ncbi:MAG: hypothetical protein HWN81_20090 [Candidatus Lokiarchaeota archaeon]|nr:hypothetical protein [Candidatus Lokiarchaeota archaeon]
MQTIISFYTTNMNYDSQHLNLSDVDYSNATVISDGYNGIYWNDGRSEDPDIEVGENGTIYAVWWDSTAGLWGGGIGDDEIMFARYTDIDGWSNVTIISDGYDGTYWNDEFSFKPDMAIDDNGMIHVVWYDATDGIWGTDSEIMYVNYSEAMGWSNVTIISDGYNGVYWNDQASRSPKIAIGENETIHVVWGDDTEGIWTDNYSDVDDIMNWGSIDTEIMHASYSELKGWSNITIISDGYDGIYWNKKSSINPDIAVDKNGIIHVVWEDYTDGIWGSDTEIMYVNYSEATGWSNVTIVSDGYDGIYWNNGGSQRPKIAIDEDGIIHAVWEDYTSGVWGTDTEIMYANYSEALGWSNITVISDGYDGIYWNNGFSFDPDIAVADNGTIHIVWEDYTNGVWGSDVEIMYASYSETTGWSDITVISDGFMGIYWNDYDSYDPHCVWYNNQLYVVWEDFTTGVWGSGWEIMFTSVSFSITQEDQERDIPFGNLYLFIMIISIIGLTVYTNRKK